MPAKYAVGYWNFREIKQRQAVGRFNGFLKSVILRINEARDLGEVDRYEFYDHLKDYIAEPPDVLCVDEKHIREHSVPNICGVIIGTNYRTSGIYLPPDVRRHFVAWSELVRGAFSDDYFTKIYDWYEAEGYAHVATYLDAFDLSAFDPKAPPPKTAAWHDIVDANRAPEDAELADILDVLGNPEFLTLKHLAFSADPELHNWLTDRKNRRAVPHRLDACGYVPVRNSRAADGLWKIEGTRQVVYGKKVLSPEGCRTLALARETGQWH